MCDFCEKRTKEYGIGIPFSNSWVQLSQYGDCILNFDNSDGERYHGCVEIAYCPFCGDELK